MPTISMFYGILILMFFRDNSRHYLPHIHVRYQGNSGDIMPIWVSLTILLRWLKNEFQFIRLTSVTLRVTISP